VKGCYHAIGKPTGKLIVCEGYATGASIHEATGHAVAVAFNAGNLSAVALALRAKYPKLQIIIAADDDSQTDGNPGMTEARAAALAVSGLVAVPDFGQNRPDKATDFNDLHQIAGLDAVQRCINSATPLIADSASDTGATGQLHLWPEPAPLPDALPPVMAFDAELLPLALRAWVMDIAHRMQCPPDFPAVAALVAVSSLIGARAVVQPKARDDWQVVPNLWGMTVGRPGVKKSPALGEALRPLNRLQANELEAFQFAHEAWALDCRVAEMQGDEREKKAKGIVGKDPAGARAMLEPVDTPAEPTARRYIVNDATVEKLGELLQQNPWGTLSYRDELYGLLTGLDKQGQEGSRAFYLQSYDGNQGYTFDRIGRGTVHIPRVCLAMIGGIQPGRIQEYVRGAVAGGSADDGLLQRFGLTVWPDTAGDFVHVDQWPDTPAKQTAGAVFERLAQLEPANDTDPKVWRFDDAAQALFVEWLVPFEQEIRGEELHPAMVSHLSKYRKLIPALALVFALIDTPDSANLIGETELIRALAMGDYLRTHAERLYAAAVMPETAGARALLTKIRTGKLTDTDGVMLDSFTPRMVASKHWACLETPDAVRKAADVLADWGWLVSEVKPTGTAGGRPSERYLVNPKGLKSGAA
jgi:putative DNA primase/helicase